MSNIEKRHIVELLDLISGFINITDPPLKWEEINIKIRTLAKYINISNSMKLLLSTTGSITKSLEILAEAPVFIQTIFQNISNLKSINTDLNNEIITKNFKEISKLLQHFKIYENDELNFREVWIRDFKNKYVFAISITPIKYLRDEFKKDLIQADIPIGKLIDKYKIECRREISNISWIKYSHLKDLNIEWNDLNLESKIPYRVYNLINNKEILMTIIEFFNPKIF